MGIVKSMTKGVNNFTLYQLKDKRKAENHVQYYAVDTERKVIVSFFYGFYAIDDIEYYDSEKLDKKLYTEINAGFQFDYKAFYDYIELTFGKRIDSFTMSNDDDCTCMTIEITEDERIVDLSLNDETFRVEISIDTEFVENTYTLKQFQKIYKDISDFIANVTEFDRALNNHEIV